MGKKKGGRGGGRGRHMVQNAEDLAKRNEKQAAYAEKRAARRGEDAPSDESDLESVDEEELAAQMDAMRAGTAEGDAKEKKKKSSTEGLIKTANPNAANAQHRHQKASALGGDAPKVELTRREREEIEKQRAAAAYAKRHAEGKTDEFKADMERLKAAKARREADAAKAKKGSEDAERQKALADMEKSLTMKADKGSFFEVAPEDVGPPPKLESRAVKKMKPPQLKEELKLRNLSTQGNAKQLLARLLEAAC
mmetsp:Transcript_18612/g.55355  ORF Transcript_18612/g.55355 Transcript_18612/m.55355 type:complete len:252 (+) Transcript_18612:280-1035(+)